MSLWKNSEGDIIVDAMGQPIDCDDCPCGGATVTCETICTDDTAPEEFEVVIAGITNNTCTNCTDLNDTYIVPSNDGFSNVITCAQWYFGNTFCKWRLFPAGSLSPSCGGATQWAINMAISYDGTDLYINVILRYNTNDIIFRKTYVSTSSIDCTALSDTDIPFVCTNASFRCNASGATCKVTAL